MSAQEIETAKIALTLAVLAYASYSDHKTREVTNTAWIIYGPVAATLTLWQFLLYEPQNIWYLPILSIAITWTFAIILFYAGAFGGADAKALMCIALAHPLYPWHALIPIYTTPTVFFPISALTNAILIAALSVVYVLTRNLIWKKKTHRKLFEGTEKESLARKTLTLLTGYKISLEKLKTKPHFYPLEDINTTTETEEKKRKLLVFPKLEEKEQILNRLENAVNTGKIKDYIWATPGLPMLIFVTAGLILALFVGDLLWIALGFLLPT